MRREHPDQPILGVGAVIIGDGKIVLVRRGVEPALGKWSIPGGALDLGEAFVTLRSYGVFVKGLLKKFSNQKQKHGF